LDSVVVLRCDFDLGSHPGNERKKMKVGDLVHFHGHCGIIVEVTASATLVKWLDEYGPVEDVDNYSSLGLEVISASR